MARFDGSNHIPTLTISNGRVGRIKVESAKPTVAWRIKKTVDENLPAIATLSIAGMTVAVIAAIAHR